MEPYPTALTATQPRPDDEIWRRMVGAIDVAVRAAQELHEGWPQIYGRNSTRIVYSGLMARLQDEAVGPVTTERRAELAAMPYREYLQTDEWKRLRRLVRELHERCQMCGSAGPFNTHHQTYENRGEEAVYELTLACDRCHARHHGKRR